MASGSEHDEICKSKGFGILFLVLRGNDTLSGSGRGVVGGGGGLRVQLCQHCCCIPF